MSNKQKDLFKLYRPTTIEERRQLRAEFNQLKRTDQFRKWLKWAFRMQRGQCFYCDTSIKRNRNNYHVEHRIPIYYGGTNDFSNLVLSCPSCNITKGTDQLIRNKKFLRENNEKRKVPKVYR